MKKNGHVFHTKRMPEKWRRHFMIYRAKISIYLDTPDFETPLMLDASEVMGLLPADVDQASFTGKLGPVTPGAESVWVEAALPDGLPSRPNVRRLGAMVHRSVTRTSFEGASAWTGADQEYRVESYLRDADGLAVKVQPETRIRLDENGFLAAIEFIGQGVAEASDNPFKQKSPGIVASVYEPQDPGRAVAIELVNRVLFALALVNCRNVSLRERKAPRGAAGAGPVGAAFHEVVIDGSARGSNTAGADSDKETVRRHLARGHFKTFTEDAPLLGKHVGTYWWGWQLRGQEGRGVIEKTYTLKAGR